ncbi:MAG: hypothetical protein GXY43_09425 [Clostridiaceae bacterium]|nr:hypothetical protein [Clostridiaceae bacterium]
MRFVARADIGVVMSGFGFDADIDAADIALINDDPGERKKARRLIRI